MKHETTRHAHRPHAGTRRKPWARLGAAAAAVALGSLGAFAPLAPGTMAPASAAAVSAVADTAINSASDAAISVNLTYAGEDAPEETFTVKAEALDHAIAPANGTTQACTLSRHTPKGEVTFAFDFPEIGTYRYRFGLEAGTTPGVAYAADVYEAEFEVYTGTSGLEYVMRVAKPGEAAAKPASISFANTYECPDCNAGVPDGPGKPGEPGSGSGTDCPDGCCDGNCPDGAGTGGSGPDGSGTAGSGTGGSGTQAGAGSGDNAAGVGATGISQIREQIRGALSHTGASVGLAIGASAVLILSGVLLRRKR